MDGSAKQLVIVVLYQCHVSKCWIRHSTLDVLTSMLECCKIEFCRTLLHDGFSKIRSSTSAAAIIVSLFIVSVIISEQEKNWILDFRTCWKKYFVQGGYSRLLDSSLFAAHSAQSTEFPPEQEQDFWIFGFLDFWIFSIFSVFHFLLPARSRVERVSSRISDFWPKILLDGRTEQDFSISARIRGSKSRISKILFRRSGLIIITHHFSQKGLNIHIVFRHFHSFSHFFLFRS
jgi:hypothetical protein